MLAILASLMVANDHRNCVCLFDWIEQPHPWNFVRQVVI